MTLTVVQPGRRTGAAFDSFLQTFTLGTSLGAIGIAAVGSKLVPMIFGSGYEDSGVYLWPLMAAAALAAPVLFAWIPAAAALEKSYFLAVHAGAAGGMNVLLNWLLIPQFGVTGCVWATLLSTLGATLVAMRIFRLDLPVSEGAVLMAAWPALISAIVALRGGPVVSLLAGIAAAAFYFVVRRAPLLEGLATARTLMTARERTSAS